MKTTIGFEEALRARNLKVTPQRMLLLGEVSRLGHVGIDELYEKVKTVSPSVSLATIYKNVNLLVEEGVMKEVPIEGRKSVYEIDRGDHIHFVCRTCGFVEDFNTDSDELCAMFTERYGRQIDGFGITLSGHCSKCRQ